MKVNELEKNSTLISARVNAHFINLLKEGGISISSVVESMTGYFLTLSDAEKMKFLSLYSPKNMDVAIIQYPKKVLSDVNQQYKGDVDMEPMREILMNANEDDLSILGGYFNNTFTGKYYQAKLNSMEPKYQKVNELLKTLLEFGRGVFGKKLEYEELLCKVAERIDFLDSVTLTGAADSIEIEIIRQFIINNFIYIPDDEKTKLFSILGREAEFEYEAGINILRDIAIDQLPETVLYKLTCWIADSALQAFAGKKAYWESDKIIEKAIGNLLTAHGHFRKTLLFPIFHMAMLRHKYRYQQVPKCSSCNTPIIPGSKFCGECGGKLT